MKKVSEIVQKIEKQYVSHDCIQFMIPYEDAITVLNQNGVLFHSKIGSNLYINKYLEDERRERFPYSKIPTHYSKIGLKKYSYTNQLLEFEKPYICVRDGIIYESYVIKDNDEALLIKKILDGAKTTNHMTYDELTNFIKKADNNEQVYYVYLDGSMPLNDCQIYPDKEKIYSYIQKKLMQNVKDLRGFKQSNSNDDASIYLKDNPQFLEYVEAAVKKLDLSLIDFNIDTPTLIVARVNNDNITIQGVNAVFVREDDFKVDIYDIPVAKFVLEQLKYVPKMNVFKELYNPHRRKRL